MVKPYLFDNHPIVFHWHGDQFEIPENKAINLLYSEAKINQAFIYGDTVIALQFHLEMEDTDILRMIESCCYNLNDEPFVQNIQTPIRGTTNSLHFEKLIRRLLNKFIGSDSC